MIFLFSTETRPYMRVRQAQVRMNFQAGNFEDAAYVIPYSGFTIMLSVALFSATCTHMLRLCPGDNLGQRNWLPSLLNRVGRFSDALYFCQVSNAYIHYHKVKG